MSTLTILLCFLSLSLTLIGCVASGDDAMMAGPATPTVVTLFSGSDNAVGAQTSSEQPLIEPTTAALFQIDETAGPTATPAPRLGIAAIGRPAPIASTVEISVVVTPVPRREIIIYDDELNPDWSLEYTEAMTYDPRDTSHWFEILDSMLELHSGAVALALAPQTAANSLLFTIKSAESKPYPRAQVRGVSFWLTTNTDKLTAKDLSVTVVSSNDRAYWDPDDRSAIADKAAYADEESLFALNADDSIPPQKWVRIDVWLDEEDSTDFSFITGIAIRNSSEFLSPFVIDRVALITTQ